MLHLKWCQRKQWSEEECVRFYRVRCLRNIIMLSQFMARCLICGGVSTTPILTQICAYLSTLSHFYADFKCFLHLNMRICLPYDAMLFTWLALSVPGCMHNFIGVFFVSFSVESISLGFGVCFLSAKDRQHSRWFVWYDVKYGGWKIQTWSVPILCHIKRWQIRLNSFCFFSLTPTLLDKFLSAEFSLLA